MKFAKNHVKFLYMYFFQDDQEGDAVEEVSCVLFSTNKHSDSSLKRLVPTTNYCISFHGQTLKYPLNNKSQATLISVVVKFA